VVDAPQRSLNNYLVRAVCRNFENNLAHDFAGVIAAKEKEVAGSFLKMESAVYEQIGPQDKR
jgi:hypothetical protein